MPLTPGTRLGSYEILSQLGAGGMGEVYRARDIKLGRAVAVKIVREGLADSDHVLRFEREAKLLAALNHPHIAALYGMDQADGRHFLVMELVEGETIADRLRRGVMPVGDTLKVALQIAEALEAAHEKGIVHRDLKPANVKITPDDQVKVLDFGLAKAVEADRPGASQGDSPTVSMLSSQAGIILGTAAYMSPEQAKGFPADHRSDVFSFGVVLYEMLTGRQPFQGETASEVLASVLVREADLTRLSADLNPRLSEALGRCLEKSPKRRWQAIGDLRTELEGIAAAPKRMPATGQLIAPRPLWRRALPVVLTAIIASTLAGVGVWRLRPAPQLDVTRLSVLLPEGQLLSATGRHLVDISPDGTMIAYVASNRLYLRVLSEPEAKAIAGMDNSMTITTPAFSPDSRSIAFVSRIGQTLRRVAVSGGPTTELGPSAPPFGVSWGPDGIVVGQGAAGIIRVPETGGKPEKLVTVKGDEVAQRPQVLPGGTHVLYTLATGTSLDRWDKARIVVESLATHERSVILDGGSDGQYVEPGYLVYAIGGTLFAAPFDLRHMKVGVAVPVVEGVKRASTGTGATGSADFHVSRTGTLLYVPGPAAGAANLLAVALCDRHGAVELLKLLPAPFESVSASPNGRDIALGTSDGKEAVIWTYDMAGSTSMQRLTYGRNNRFPVWSRDGTYVTFQSDREGDLAIFRQRADRTGEVERLTTPDPGTSHTPESWSPTSDTLLFSVTKGNEISLWTFTLADRKVAPFGNVKSTKPNGAVFSPDGRWVAYSSDADIRLTVYVQPFPATGARYQLFASGSDGPHHQVWSRDGKELLYNPGPAAFEAVTFTTGATVGFSNPVAVARPFQTGAASNRRSFDIARDGRILGLVAPGQTTAFPHHVIVVLNWTEELKRLVK